MPVGLATETVSQTDSAGAADRLAVSLFGAFAARFGDRPVEIKSKKAQALLGYLLLNSSLRESRERLGGLLWSESTEEKARMSLRQTLHQLRESLEAAGFSGLRLGHEDVSLAGADLAVDVWSVMEEAAAGKVAALLLDRKRLPETVLSGLEDIDPSFRVWLLVQRQALQERLERQLESALDSAAHVAALKPLAQALLNLDPTHEVACRRLMQAYAEGGDVASALRIYKGLWDLLDEEYGTEPSEQTMDLVVRIKNGEFNRASATLPAGAPASAAAAPSRNVESERDFPGILHNLLIVSEFDIRGVDEERAYLVHALRHQLISKLVRFRDWSVLEGAPPKEFEAPHAARYFCIDGTVREARGALALTLTLKEYPLGRYVWGDSYALDVVRWFELQQSVLRRLALALNVHLSVERLMFVAGRPDVSLTVFDRWLRGQELNWAWTPAAWTRAKQIFESIIEEAPNFAPGYIGLVRIKNAEQLVFPGIRRTDEKHREVFELARTAVQKDPLDARAHHCFAWASAMSHRFDQAQLSFGLALDLNENEPWTLTSGALGLAFCGKHQQALDLAEQALRLSPNPVRTYWAYQGQIRFLCEDYAGCVEAGTNAQNILPFFRGWHAAALSHLGRREEARAQAKAFLEESRANWHGSEVPSDAAISSWLLGAFPFAAQSDWERLRDGLRQADIPVDPELTKP